MKAVVKVFIFKGFQYRSFEYVCCKSHGFIIPVPALRISDFCVAKPPCICTIGYAEQGQCRVHCSQAMPPDVHKFKMGIVVFKRELLLFGIETVTVCC